MIESYDGGYEIKVRVIKYFSSPIKFMLGDKIG